MQKIVRGLAAASIVCSGLASSLSASAAPSGADESAVYLGATLGTANGKSKVYERGKEPSFGFTLGYRLTPNQSVELYARTLNFALFEGLFEPQDYYYPEDHIGVSWLGSLPLSDKLGLYGRLGVGSTRMVSAKSQGSRRDTEGSGGIGLSYAFTPHIVTKLEYMRLFKSELNLLSAGFEYRF
ncbi:porin family protein [Paucibacter sp. AS339]|uniref:porin family protein n=1 Tax=Paucibacter hankyongi TaxID=3133434 RepID=UPI0030977ACD